MIHIYIYNLYIYRCIYIYINQQITGEHHVVPDRVPSFWGPLTVQARSSSRTERMRDDHMWLPQSFQKAEGRGSIQWWLVGNWVYFISSHASKIRSVSSLKQILILYLLGRSMGFIQAIFIGIVNRR